jgi:hypothetical protein
MPRTILALLAFLSSVSAPVAQQAAPRPAPGKLPSIEEKTTGFQKIDGYFPM